MSYSSEKLLNELKQGNKRNFVIGEKIMSADEITIEDFMKIDLRVGKVLEAGRIPNTKNLIKLKVDLGGEVRQIIAGLAKWYEPDYFVGKLVIVVANLKPKKIRGELSQGMLLAADAEEKPVLLTVMEEVPPGTRIR